MCNILAEKFKGSKVQKFFYMLAGVGKSRHLVLSAKFALTAKPVVEEVFACLHYLEAHHIDVLESLRLIVAVEFLQFAVEYRSKLIDAFRFLGKLYEPLMVGHHSL